MKISKKILIGLGIGVLVAIFGAAYIVNESSSSPDKILAKFLKSQAALTQLNLQTVYESGGNSITRSVAIDTVSKGAIDSRDIKCTTNYGGNVVTAHFLMYIDGDAKYIKLYDANGLVKLSPQLTRDTATVFSKIKNTWYQVTVPDQANKSMSEAGVFVYDTGVVAPSYDSAQIAQSFTKSNVYQRIDYTKTDNGYNVVLKIDRSKYSNFLKSNFPNLKNEKIILDNIFEGQTTKTVSITGLQTDGTYESSTTDFENFCKIVYQTFIGINPTDQPSRVKGMFKYVGPTDVNRQNVTDPRRYDLIVNDYVLQ